MKTKTPKKKLVKIKAWGIIIGKQILYPLFKTKSEADQQLKRELFGTVAPINLTYYTNGK